MEQHPDCQPRRAETVDGGNYYDADCDQDFKSKRIDDGLAPLSLLIYRGGFYGVTCVYPCACAAGDVEQIRKALLL